MSRRGRDDEPFLFDLPLVPDEEPRPPAKRPEPKAASEPEPASERWRRDEVWPEAAGGEEPAARREPAADDLPLFAPDPFADDELALAAPPARGHRHPAGSHPDVPPADPLGWDVVDSDSDDLASATALAAAPAASAAAPERAPLVPRLGAIAVDGMALGSVTVLALVGATLLDVRPGAAMLPGLALLVLVFSFAYSVVPLAFWGATPGMAAVHLVARDRDGGPLTFGQTALRWLAGLLTLLLAGLPLLVTLGGRRSLADRLSRSLTWRRR